MNHRYITEVQQKIANQETNVFLCYRGTTAEGGEAARLIYYNLLICNHPELVPFCASLCNDHEDFQLASLDSLRSCKVFVPIFTPNFCDGAALKEDDQVRFELAIIFGEKYDKNKSVHIVPVYAGGNKDQPTFLKKLEDWLLTPDTIKILRRYGYFTHKTDAELHVLLADFTEKLRHVESHPVNFAISDPSGEPLQETLARIVNLIKRAYDKKLCESTGKIWVGTRLSDIANTGTLLNGAITLFGENNEERQHYALCDEQERGRVDHNIQEERQDAYLRDKMHELVHNSNEQNPISFYFYNQLSKYTIAGLEDISSHCICVNPENLLKKISNKRSFQENYGHIAGGKGLLQVELGSSVNCDYTYICQKLGVAEEENRKFIVQAAVASGGSGTYIMTRENAHNLRKHLSQESAYLYSVYQEQNVPVNLHAIIFKEGIILLPGSIQLMRTDYDKLSHDEEIKRLMYRGADFVEYRRLASLKDDTQNKVNSRHIRRFEALCEELCLELKQEGYIGILGIDGMIYGDEVRLLEVNCRFQASTGLINRALAEKNESDSVQKANFDAFYNPAEYTYWKKAFDQLEVNFSNYSFNNIGCNEHPKHIFEIVGKTEHAALLEPDGYCTEADPDACAANAHLFRMNFRTNISWVNEEGTVVLNENISEPIKEFKDMILSCAGSAPISRDAQLALKIALLTQGVVIEPETLHYLEGTEAKGIRPATNSAVDLSFSRAFMERCGFSGDVSAFVINAPRDIKFNEFTPFLLRKKAKTSGDMLTLYYYDTEIAEISLYPLDPIERDGDRVRLTRNRVPYSEVAYLSTDRLRVHVTNSCLFKENDRGCRFCNIERSCSDIDIADIREVIDAHWAARKQTGLRHFLIGGQSPKQNTEMQNKLNAIISHIHSLGPTPPSIYAMILPCQTEDGMASYSEVVQSYFKSGLNELSLNIEIFDDLLAKKYMPGKGNVSREMYRRCLLMARDAVVKQLGRSRAKEAREKIRTMIIYGLEPKLSFASGMKWLIENGIQPIISLFRPLKNTPLENCIAPSMVEVYHLYKDMEELYAQANEEINLGPICSYCQNNTLSLPAQG